MSQPKTRVRRVRVHIPDRDLVTTRVRGVKWASECETCHGAVMFKTRREAKEHNRAHRLYHAQASPLSLAGPL